MGREGLKPGGWLTTPHAVRARRFWQELDQTWPISASHR
jgi:hypothetical protein